MLRPGKFGCLECNITMITVMQLKTSSLKLIQFSFMARVASTKAIENSYIMILCTRPEEIQILNFSDLGLNLQNLENQKSRCFFMG